MKSLIAGCIFSALAAYLFFFVDVAVIYLRSVEALWNLGHLFVYFIVSFTLLSIGHEWFSRRTFATTTVIVFIVALLSGVAIEVLQEKVGRSASIQDMLFNLVGALLAVVVVRHRQAIKNKLLSALIIVATLICFSPVTIALYDEYRAKQQFPVISSFDSVLEQSRFATQLDTQVSNGSLYVTFTPQLYATINWFYFPRDWRAYDTLVIDINNPAPSAVDLTCRIHDKAHGNSLQFSDRFNRRLSIEPNEQSLRIRLQDVKKSPVSRDINMQQIASLACFTTNLTNSKQLIFNEIRLEKDEAPHTG